jgi:hypothetical protein
MTKIRVFAAIILLALQSNAGATLQSALPNTTAHRVDVASQFAAVDQSRGLFDAGGGFMLRPVIDTNGNLDQVRVAPKHFFNDKHPEWPDSESPVWMSSDLYQTVLQKISALQPLRQLMQAGQVGLTLNNRTTYWDQYDNGLVERAMYRSSSKDAEVTAWFVVYFFRTISGQLESKQVRGFAPSDRQYILKINGQSYRTTKQMYDPLRTGSKVSVTAAGPTESGQRTEGTE